MRATVFERADNICEICRKRRADSMHECKPRSLGGEISTDNSIAVCGSGTTGCHGFAQRYEMVVYERVESVRIRNGNGRLWRAATPAAERWLNASETAA